MTSSRMFGLLGLALVALSGLAHAASHMGDGGDPMASDLRGGNETASHYSNFYEAVEMYGQNHDGELSSLKGFIDAFPGIKSLLEAETNGTLLAPDNKAAMGFLMAVGYGSNGNEAITPEELLGFDQLKAAVEDSLKLHFLNGSYPGSMYHDWWLTENMNKTADTLLGENLYLWSNGNSTDGNIQDLSVYYEMDAEKPAAKVVYVDAIRTNDTSFDQVHEGHVHIIDHVLLPAAVRGLRFNFKDIIDKYTGESGSQEDFTLDTVAAAVGLSNDAKYAVLGPNLQGAVFAPTDAAFTEFYTNYNTFNETGFLGSMSRVKRVLYEHMINSGEVMAEANTTKSFTTYKESGANGAGTGETVMVEFEDTDGDDKFEVVKLKNERGEEANVVAAVGPNFQGGWVYVIDKVIVSNSTMESLKVDRRTTADGAWKESLPNGATAEDAEEAEALLNAAGLGDLMDNADEFNFWLPTKSALNDFLGTLDDFGLEDLKSESRSTQLREFMNSYRVSSTQYAGDDGEGTMESDRFYQTMNQNVELKKSDNGIEIRDVTTGRRLLATGSATDPITFGNGKVIYYMSSIPVTTSMQQAVLDSGASQAYPSIFTMAWAALAAVVALLSL